jgi:D-3-phosphoglycerate dehydrogenase
LKKILINGTKLPHVEKEIEILSKYALVVFNNTEDKNELYEILKDINIVMTDETIIDNDFINHSPCLELIIQYGVGFDNIDIEKAGKRGIFVSNVPDAYYKEVAEHAITLILSISRQIHLWNDLVKEEKKWDFNVYPVRKIYGKKLGLIGCGRIGGYVAKMAEGLGMDVIIFDPYLNQSKLVQMSINAELVRFDTLLSESDIISVHAPLTPETNGLIGEKEISLMKNDVIIVNVSRSLIIKESAILKGLKSGKIFGVGLDILDDEKTPSSPLLDYKNVIVSPHVAWKSEDAAMNNEMLAVEEAVRFIMGEPLKNVVNKRFLNI